MTEYPSDRHGKDAAANSCRALAKSWYPRPSIDSIFPSAAGVVET